MTRSRGGGSRSGSPLGRRKPDGPPTAVSNAARTLAHAAGSDGIPVTLGCIVHWLPRHGAGGGVLQGVVRYDFDTVASLRAALSGVDRPVRCTARTWSPTAAPVTSSAVWPAPGNYTSTAPGAAPWAPMLLTGHADGGVYLWQLPAAATAPAADVSCSDLTLGAVANGRCLGAHSGAGAPAGTATSVAVTSAAAVALSSDGTTAASVSSAGQLLCFDASLVAGAPPRPPITGLARDAVGVGGLFGGRVAAPPPLGGGGAGAGAPGDEGGDGSGDDPFALVARDGVWVGRWDVVAPVAGLCALPGSHHLWVVTGVPARPPPGGDAGDATGMLASARDVAVALIVDGDAGVPLTHVDLEGVASWVPSSDGGMVLLQQQPRASGGRTAITRITPGGIVIAGCPPLCDLAAAGAIGDGSTAVAAYASLSGLERHQAADGDGAGPGSAGWAAVTAALRRSLPQSPTSGLGSFGGGGGGGGGGGAEGRGAGGGRTAHSGGRRPGHTVTTPRPISPLGGGSTWRGGSVGGGISVPGTGTASGLHPGTAAVRAGRTGKAGSGAATPADPLAAGLGDILGRVLAAGGVRPPTANPTRPITGLRGGGGGGGGGSGPDGAPSPAAPTDGRAMMAAYATAVGASRDARNARLAASLAELTGRPLAAM